MRLYTFTARKRLRLGAEAEGRIIDLNAAHASRLQSPNAVLAPDMLALIRGGPALLREAHAALRHAERNPRLAAGFSFAPARVRVHAPIPRPGKIFCCGLNYRSHVEENPKAVFLGDPRFFVKVPSAVIGPDEPIRWLGARFQTDYEVELAVVFARDTHQVSQAKAMQHIFGYTILHDVSARWVQFKDRNEDMGKNFDTFAPMGPCIVTADEIPDPSQLRLSLKLNGQLMQNGTNSDWCFPLPRLVEWLSMGTTLEAGDVMTTGTPAGIGYFRSPQVFLQPGDVCELEIERIGRLINSVVAAPYRFRTEPAPGS